MADLDFRILGSLEALRDGEQLALGGAKQRALLAILLINANRVVSTDFLIEALWPHKPPGKPLTAIQGYVSALRKVLAPGQAFDVIVTEPAGYRLLIEPAALDLLRFDAFSERGRAALASEQPLEASRALTEALALFRGAPFADFTYEDWARGEIDRIEELRLASFGDRIEADIALGRHAELVGEIEVLIAEHPLRERFRGQLMLALYRSGRQAEALDVYQATRKALVDALGLEPGPEIQSLHGQILNQDPVLAPPDRARLARVVQLPTPASTFVGRERELVEITALIGRDDVRLVTLTGPGGTGKTRLALEAAAGVSERFSDGVYWVALATLRDPAMVIETVSLTLGSKDGLAEHIGKRKLLLLLDNLEQVIGAAQDLSSVLQSCPNLTLLITSRELLRVQGEVEYAVPPLAEPEAISLFCERAQLNASEEIAELCLHLDNLPLAVELAAARTKAFSPAQILERVSQRLDLLKGGRDADPRQQTLRTTIEWSHELLSEPESQLFARLSVFAGGCTLDAAQDVVEADLDTLESLVEKSLVRFSGERYWMLETIREYAAERLKQSGDRDLLRDRHLEYVATQTFQRRALVRDYDPDASAYLRSEHENVREALGWAVESDKTEPAQQIVMGAWFYWITGGHASEGDEWASRVAALAAQPSAATASVLSIAAEFPRFRGDPEQARSLKKRAIAIAQQLDAKDPVVARGLAHLHSDLSDVLGLLGDLDHALEHVELAVSIARDLGDPHTTGHALEAAALVAERRNDALGAQALYEESVATREGVGKPLEATFALVGLSSARLSLGDLVGATSAVEEASHRATAAGDEHVMFHAVAMRALIAWAEGDFQRAVRLLAQAQTTAKAGGFAIEVGARDLEAVLAECRAALGDDAFEQAYRAGAEEAVSPSALDASA
jgi:predicted ATPase/DNA-binding SARP family transcriptional activator